MNPKSNLLIVVIFFTVFFSCSKDQDDSTPNSQPPIYTNGEGVIGSKGGTIKIEDSNSYLNGIKAIIPEGALSQEVNISISEVEQGEIEIPGDSEALIIKLEPKGTTFKKTIDIILPLSSEDSKNVAVWYYSENDKEMVQIPFEYNSNAEELSFQINHFSYYSMNKNNVHANLLLNYNPNTHKLLLNISVDGWVLGNNYGLSGVNVFPLNLVFGVTNAKQALLEGESLLGYNMLSYFNVEIKKHNSFWIDEPIAEKKILVKRTGTKADGYGAAIYKTNLGSDNLLYEAPSLNEAQIETYFSGDALSFDFDIELDSDKKYYVVAKWGLVGTPDGIHPRYTAMYTLNTLKQQEAQEPSTMRDSGYGDIDGNSVVDKYEVSYAPQAKFSVSSTNIDKGQPITFTDESTNEPTSWKWDFGDGTTSNKKDDTHTYNAAGIYTVSLTVTNDTGSATETKTDYITVNETGSAPVAAFTADKTKIKEDETITFTDQSANDPTSWNWDFGDGNSSTSQKPNHTYTTAGIYTVSLTASNNIGSDTETKTDYITVEIGLSKPEVSSGRVESITTNSATTFGKVVNEGGETPSAVGFIWNTSGNPTLNDKTGYSTESYNENNGEFSGTLANLSANTTYYVRAYATNNAGSGYGVVHEFTTLTSGASTLPDVATGGQVKNITTTTAEITSSVNDDGGGVLTAKGIVWSSSIEYCELADADGSTNDGTATGAYTSQLSGLTANTTYYVRAYATNSKGTAYGSPISFTTQNEFDLPSLITIDVVSIETNRAFCGGELFSDGGTDILSYGVVWNRFGDPTIENNLGMTSEDPFITGTRLFRSEVTNLNPLTTYYVKAYATNSQGTAYGSERIFTTLSDENTGSVTDYEGNSYKTVKIGTQWWMAENLKATKYADGTAIPHIENYLIWNSLGDNNSDKGYSYIYYGNSSVAGAFYSFAAATNGLIQKDNIVQGVCPEGWHIPNNAEWQILQDYLISNGYNYDGSMAGNKIGKSLASTDIWVYLDAQVGDVGNDRSTNNSSGFNGKPWGGMDYDGDDLVEGYQAIWWSSSESNDTDASIFRLVNTSSGMERLSYYKSSGHNVRCIKD